MLDPRKLIISAVVEDSAVDRDSPRHNHLMIVDTCQKLTLGASLNTNTDCCGIQIGSEKY